MGMGRLNTISNIHLGIQTLVMRDKKWQFNRFILAVSGPLLMDSIIYPTIESVRRWIYQVTI